MILDLLQSESPWQRNNASCLYRARGGWTAVGKNSRDEFRRFPVVSIKVVLIQT